MEIVKYQWLLRLVGRGRIGGTQRFFRAVKLFCVILSWWTHVIHLSKPLERTIPNMNLNVNYGLWVIVICQCSFISCNKCAALVWDSDRGTPGMCGVKEYMRTLYSLLTFAVNLKLLFKKSIKEKKTTYTKLQ